MLGSPKVWILGSSIIKRAAMCAVPKPAVLNLNLKNTLIIWQDTVAWSYKTCSQNFPHCYNRASSLFSFSHCGTMLAKLLLESWHWSFFQHCFKSDPCTLWPVIWSLFLPKFTLRISNNIWAMETIMGKIKRKALKLLSSKGGHYKKHPHSPEKTTQLVWLRSSSSIWAW